MRIFAHARSVAPAVLLAVGAALSVLPAAFAEAQAGAEGTLCSDAPRPVALGSAHWNGWGRGPDNTRYQPEPAIRASDVPKLALKWAFGYPGSSVAAQPSIVDGRVFVASASGRVYALDAKSGCIYWTFDAQAGVHTAIAVAELGVRRLPVQPKPKKGKHKLTNAHLEMSRVPSAALFGDDRGAVYAVDAEKGSLLWKTQVDPQPSARIESSPVLYLDRLYVGVGSSEAEAAKEATYACCTFRGSVASLEIASGRIVWKTYLVTGEPQPLHMDTPGAEAFGPAGAAIAAPPAVDAARGLIYVATQDSYNPNAQPLADAIVALDILDGKVRWAKQLIVPEGAPSAFDAAPVLRAAASGRLSLLAGQRSGVVYSLDPDRAGEINWQTPLQAGKVPGSVGWGTAADHRSLYVPLTGLGTDPPDTSGSLAAVDIRTGAKRWLTPSPVPACSWTADPAACSHAMAQAVSVIPGAAFAGSRDGHLRAYSTIDGKILWDYDTAKDFVTVNHVKAAGGSLDRGGPTIVNGVVFVNSGSAPPGQSGNVLLAFSVDGK